jgi:hypothetical protein
MPRPISASLTGKTRTGADTLAFWPLWYQDPLYSSYFWFFFNLYDDDFQEHRHLLKHPVITSFLWFKWQRIRRYFNRNLRFYVLFVYLLTWFIFNDYGSASRAHVTDLVWFGGFVVLFTAMVAFILRDWIREKTL